MLYFTSDISRSPLKKATTCIRNMRPLFIATVLIPTILAVLYYGIMASDVYTSESRFIVRTQGKQAPTGLASFLVGGELGGMSGSEVSAVKEYALSRDALAALNHQGRIYAIYSRPEIDWFSKLGAWGGTSFEKLYEYYTGKVFVENESKSSITILQVQAYRAEDAHWINEQLLRQGEALVNRLNQRSRADTIRYAQAEVAKAQQRARGAAQSLAMFRDRYGVIDPDKQATVSLQMISKLQDELIATKTNLAQIRDVAPDNPQIEALETRAASLHSEIGEQMARLAGGRSSLAGKATEYTRLTLESQFADRLLATAMAGLETANNEARRQQVYIERIVQPDRPDEATRPRRLRSIFAVLVVGLVAWGVLTMLLAAMREHQQ